MRLLSRLRLNLGGFAMICPKCGEKIPDNARVCSNCASSINCSDSKGIDNEDVKIPIFCRLPASGWNRVIGIPIGILGAFVCLLSFYGLYFNFEIGLVVALTGVALLTIGIIMFVRSFKNIYGTITIGDRVMYDLNHRKIDIDIDKISSVRQNGTATYISYNGGQLSFHSYKPEKISYEIGKRQKKKTQQVVQTIPEYPTRGAILFSSNADEIKKYKELLDSGALTKEQYDALIQKIIT